MLHLYQLNKSKMICLSFEYIYENGRISRVDVDCGKYYRSKNDKISKGVDIFDRFYNFILIDKKKTKNLLNLTASIQLVNLFVMGATYKHLSSYQTDCNNFFKLIHEREW